MIFVVLLAVQGLVFTSASAFASAQTAEGLMPGLIFQDGFEGGGINAWGNSVPGLWALEETFDGNPAAPSQDLLPSTFDFAVTHRTHPRDHTPLFDTYLGDHGPDCAGPDPSLPGGPAQHLIRTSHESSGGAPDESFYICRNHMMSTMGEVDGYSVTSFWPRQEFDFANGGVLEFEVNINDGHPRSWWEILIAPRSQLKIGAAQEWLPIDETYPEERILFTFSARSQREIAVGSGAVAPGGWIVEAGDWRRWRDIDAQDPALTDRRIRRTMRIELTDAHISCKEEKQDGSFDEYSTPLPSGLPFTRGLVLFKTHAYTPTKDHNYDLYTYHWDNIRFDGPVVGRYEVVESEEVVYLQNNGNRPIGDSETVTLDLPAVGASPVLAGQMHSPLIGQVLLRINGGPQRAIHPLNYSDVGCSHSGWASFWVPVDPSELTAGTNTFEWTVGPRPGCVASWVWNGFSIKNLELQFDQD